MADSFSTVPSLGQTAPIERLRDSRKEAIDQEGKRRRPRKDEPSAPASAAGPEPPEGGAPGETKKSGNLVDIVI